MRIIIKIGTSTITNANGLLNKDYLAKLAKDISEFANNNNEIVIVSSGAVGAGLGKLKLKNRPKTLKEKQALAAIGQPIVMSAYSQAFEKYYKSVAQILLTREDFDNRQRYINARNTLCELMNKKVIPIINENDTTSIDEIKFGDNDTLSAMVASLVDADDLIIFTDVDGLYNGNPKTGKLIKVVTNITNEIESYATNESASGKGTGGMSSKITAAKIATVAGVNTIITKGSNINKIQEIVDNKVNCTFFVAKKGIMQAKKFWIAFSKKPKGNIYVDDKCAKAIIENGKSLLSVGIVKTSGNFKRGDTVSIINSFTKREFARGLSNYTNFEIEKIKNKNTSEMKNFIYVIEDDVIHRDNLVVL